MDLTQLLHTLLAIYLASALLVLTDMDFKDNSGSNIFVVAVAFSPIFNTILGIMFLFEFIGDIGKKLRKYIKRRQ